MPKNLLTTFIISLLCFSGCATVPTVDYKSSSFLEKGTAFSRASKIAIEVDPEMSIEVRHQLSKVETAAKAAGLHCTTLAEAEYLLSITSHSHDHPGEGKGYFVFGITGKAYRLTDGGKKRSISNEWEGLSSGMKRVTDVRDMRQYLTPPWVDVDLIVAKFVSLVGVENGHENSKNFNDPSR